MATLFQLFILCLLLLGALRLWNYFHLRAQPLIFLKLIPPRTLSDKIPSTEAFFRVLHNLDKTRMPFEKLLGRRVVLSFELVSSRATGIAYVASVRASHEVQLRKALLSYLPSLVIEPTPDPRSQVPARGVELVREFRLARHFSYSLTSSETVSSDDLITYLTGGMSEPGEYEQAGMQLLLIPTRVPEARLLARRLFHGKAISWRLSLGGRLGRIVGWVFHLVTLGLFRRRQAPSISPYEARLRDDQYQKLTRPLFRVSLRIWIQAKTVEAAHQRSQSLQAALESLTGSHEQQLRSRRWLAQFLPRYLTDQLNRRLPLLVGQSRSFLDAPELALLYHFPTTPREEGQATNLVLSSSRSLPAPLSLKSGQSLDVVFGENRHHDVVTPLGLSLSERQRHMYVVGGTGNGKTTMLEGMIIQDIHHGKGVAVLDPHGDLAAELLRFIPATRHKDVIYFNPDDIGYPIGLNLLELDPSLTGDALLREKDIITESVISVFRKVFSEDDSGGHRVEYILRNAIQTALLLPNSTLFTLYQLLNDRTYLRRVLSQIDDENLLQFWRGEFGRAGDMQKVKMAAGITSKIGRFLFSASAKRILEQPHSTINFEELIDHGKILICNLSKGLLGEDTSALFGSMVLAKLQLASLRRARLAQSERRPFYVYVDEFQNFATDSFVQLLSESRKYQLFLTMAEQSTAQQADRNMIDIILANVGTVVCFRTASPRDEAVLLPLFRPFIQSGEIMNLPTFHFYARLAGVRAQEPLSGQTILPAFEAVSEPDVIIRLSRERYGHKYEAPSTPATHSGGSSRQTAKTQQKQPVGVERMAHRKNR